MEKRGSMNLDTNKKIQDEVKKTIAVLDNIEKIEGNPYLFTRVKATLNSPKKEGRFSFASVFGSPRIALILVLLFFNLASTILFFTQNKTAVASDESFISSLTQEYYLSTDDDLLGNLEGLE